MCVSDLVWNSSLMESGDLLAPSFAPGSVNQGGGAVRGCAAALPRTVGITLQRSRHGTIAYYKYQCPLPILVLGFGYNYPFRLYNDNG